MDTANNVKDKYSFDKFGNDQAGGKQSANASKVLNKYFGYAGEMWDSEAGLQYLRARYYDPEIGRFLTRDSITGVIENPLSQNRYTYAWNNPVNYTDPSGHWPEFLDNAVKSAVNFGKKVVDSVVDFGRNAVNKVTSFFTGSSRSQTSASSSGRTSSTTAAGSGRRKEDEIAHTANSTVKRATPSVSYGSSVKCHATLAVRDVGDVVNDIWEFARPDEMTAIWFQAGGPYAPLTGATGYIISKSGEVASKLIRVFSKGIPKLNPNQQAVINKLNNVINHNLKEHDFIGVEKELKGIYTGFDHVKEMKQSQTALTKVKRSLEGSLKNPNLDPVTRSYLQDSLDKTNDYLNLVSKTLGGK